MHGEMQLSGWSPDDGLSSHNGEGEANINEKRSPGSPKGSLMQVDDYLPEAEALCGSRVCLSR